MSVTGLYIRNARRRPSKLGIANAAVIITLPRCGISAPLVELMMSVSGSVAPLMLLFWRFTVPTIGPLTWKSLEVRRAAVAVGAVLKSAGKREGMLDGSGDGADHLGDRDGVAAARSICAFAISKSTASTVGGDGCSSATAAAGGAMAMT